MTAASVESRAWPLSKWGVIIAVIFGIHFALIWLSARTSRSPSSPPSSALEIRALSDSVAGLPGVVNPVLLARPNTRGFSLSAWLQVPSVRYTPDAWSEPPRLLPYPDAPMAGALAGLIANWPSQPLEFAAKAPPQIDAAGYVPAMNMIATESTLSIEGPLAKRHLLSTIALKPQPADAILTNTIVQVEVNADGRVFSPPVMLKTCGSKDADQTALTLAKGLRFQPLPRKPEAVSSLTPGRLIFRWYAVATNAPNTSP